MELTELEVWKEAVSLVVNICRLTNRFPYEEKFGLTSQIRRAAVSIASNIAEGEGRRGRRDHSRFFLNARGSLYEVRTQLVISQELGYVPEGEMTLTCRQMDAVGRAD